MSRLVSCLLVLACCPLAASADPASPSPPKPDRSGPVQRTCVREWQRPIASLTCLLGMRSRQRTSSIVRPRVIIDGPDPTTGNRLFVANRREDWTVNGPEDIVDFGRAKTEDAVDARTKRDSPTSGE